MTNSRTTRPVKAQKSPDHARAAHKPASAQLRAPNPLERASAAAPPTACAPAICGSTPRILSRSTAGRGSPALLPVADSRGLLLGTALYSPASQIALRLVSRTSNPPGRMAGSARSAAAGCDSAAASRCCDEQTDSCRLCFSEADELPGLVVDKYGELVDFATAGQRAGFSGSARRACVRVLREELAPAAILERPDPRVRELEGLSAPDPAPLWLPIQPIPLPARNSSSTASSFTMTPTRARRPEPFWTSAPTTPQQRNGRRG